MFRNARARATEQGVPFSITVEDIYVPSHCPVLGIPLFSSHTRGGGPNSPSLDRIHPDKGYVPGNIVVVSNRVNTLKSNASLDELRDIASFYATLRGSVRITGAST